MSDVQFSSLSPNSSYDLEKDNGISDDAEFNDQETLSVNSDYAQEQEDPDFSVSQLYGKDVGMKNCFLNDVPFDIDQIDPFLTEIVKDESEEYSADRTKMLFETPNVFPDEPEISSGFYNSNYLLEGEFDAEEFNYYSDSNNEVFDNSVDSTLEFDSIGGAPFVTNTSTNGMSSSSFSSIKHHKRSAFSSLEVKREACCSEQPGQHFYQYHQQQEPPNKMRKKDNLAILRQAKNAEEYWMLQKQNSRYGNCIDVKASGLLDRRKTRHHKILNENELDIQAVVQNQRSPKIIKSEPSSCPSRQPGLWCSTTNNLLPQATPASSSIMSNSRRYHTASIINYRVPPSSHQRIPLSIRNYPVSSEPPHKRTTLYYTETLPKQLQCQQPQQPIKQETEIPKFPQSNPRTVSRSLHTHSSTTASLGSAHHHHHRTDVIDMAKIPEPLRMGRKVSKRGQRFSLWQFLMCLLDSHKYREYSATGIRWVNRPNGVFHIVDSKQVATLWGQYKERRDKMTYDSLARSLRHYYKKNLMAKINNRRLVYQIAQECLQWSSETFVKRISAPE